MVVNTANAAVDSLNTLYSSFALNPVTDSLTHSHAQSSESFVYAAQQRAHNHLYSLSSRHVSAVRRVTSTLLDVNCQSDGHFISTHRLGSDNLSYLNAARATVVPLIAARVSLPSEAGSVDLLSLLPPELTPTYGESINVIRSAPDMSVLSSLRAPTVVGSPIEYRLLLRRMLPLGMIAVTRHPKVINGAFCVPKDGDALRLIIDARYANAHFVAPPTIELPTPDLMCHIVSDPSRPLYVAKADLDNFYHRLRLPLWMRPYFALPAVSAADLGVVGQLIDGRILQPSDMVYPMCTCLPMGFNHAVFLAQRVHEHLIYSRAGYDAADAITSSNDLTLNRVRHHIYIDDVTWFGHDRDAVERSQADYESAIVSADLKIKRSKWVPPSCDGVESIGMFIDGRRHTIGVSPEKLARLQRDTYDFIDRGVATGIDLSVIVGRWTWCCLAARPALSVFRNVYRFIECADRKPYSLWRSVASELLTICGLAPLLFTDLSACTFPKVIASDASLTGLGVCARLLTANDIELAVSPIASDDHSCVTSPPIVDESWRTIAASHWRAGEHINVLEARALTTAVRWVLSSPVCVNTRVIMFSDSQVIIGSVLKGRSSSPSLLRRLRSLAALCLSVGLRLRLLWIPSEFNPADGPSRV